LSEVASSEETTFPGSEGTEEYKFVIPILVRIKRLLERAAPRHAALSEPDRLMAIICLDWSVETLIKTIALVCDKSYFKDKKRIRDLSFPKVWSDVNGFLVTRCGAVKKLPMELRIEKVRAVRNRAQHEAIMPDQKEVTDSHDTVMEFIHKVVKDLWRIDFSEVTGVGLVKNEAVREGLRKSEWILEKNTPNPYREAAQYARHILENVLIKAGSHVLGTMAGGNVRFSRTLEMRYIKYRLDILQRTLVLSALGVDRAKYLKCVKLTGDLVFTLQHPRGAFVEGTARTSTYEEARWVIDYCTNVMLDLEEKVGDLDRPFGESPEDLADDSAWMYDDDLVEPVYESTTGMYYYPRHDSNDDPPDPDVFGS
jgi:hypothetical protein